jgi:hypothetical protein
MKLNNEKRTKKSKPKKSKATGEKETADGALSYSGPFRPPINLAARKKYTTLLNYATQTISSDAAGVITGNVGIGNPSGAASWTKLAAVFDEFRVLSCVIQYNPVDRYDAPLAITTAVSQPPLLILIDRDSSASPASVATASGYESCKQVGLSDPFMITYRMNGVREATFVTTSTPTNSPARGFEWIASASSSTVSVTFGYLFISWLVQFRGMSV